MQTSQLLLAAAVLATASLVAFYKISLQCPPSACRDKENKLALEISGNFTIHGLWPQQANDTTVKPYDENPTCTNVTPTPSNDTTEIESELKDLDHWYEPSYREMCSDYPNNPLEVLATATGVVSDQANFEFYKLSLQWPPAVCNQGSSRCRPTVLRRFTIHGLWPQYANDNPVPPYNATTNRCAGNVTPTNPDDIIVPLQPIVDNLKRVWPNLKNYESQTMNEEFWKYEWGKHGMCSDYPNRPYDYFYAALSLANNAINQLQGMSIRPHRTELYEARAILEAIKARVTKYPEISCNEVDGILQLKEIRLCFVRGNPPTIIRDCHKKYSNRCLRDDDRIKFPPPS